MDAGHIHTLDEVEFNPFAGPEIIRVVPSIEPQLEIWASCLIGGADASRAYNESISLSLTGTVNNHAMELALLALIARHEALRCSFSADGSQLCVYREVPLQLDFQDLSASGPDDQQIAIRDFIHEEAETAFDLINGPLFRTSLFKLSETLHHLTITAHHIVCDGWSLGILLLELSQLYNAYLEGIDPKLPEAPKISSYNLEQRAFMQTAAYQKTEQYWADQYKGNVPVMNVPTDYARPSWRTYKSQRDDYPLNQALVAAVKSMGVKSGCSLVTTLLCAFEVYLQKLTGQNDIVLGLPAAGQSTMEEQHLVGHCVNLLPIRSHLPKDASFTSYLAQRKKHILADYEHQQFTFGSLLKKLNISRDPSRIPLVPIVFNIDIGMDNGVQFNGLVYKLHYNPRDYESFEIFLNAAGSENELLLEWSYNTQLFKSTTIKQMMDDFELLLRKLTLNPSEKIDDILLHRESFQQGKFEEWNHTSIAYPDNKTLPALISQIVSQFNSKTAIRFGKRKVSYSEMNEQANQLSAVLLEQQINPGDVVGLAVDRSPEMVISLLAILKAGAVYVPLDPNYPEERILYMLRDARAKLLITNQSYKGRLQTDAKELLLEDVLKRMVSFPKTDPVTQFSADSLAYILYTSGSTGKPKGVMVTHRNLVNLLCSMQRMPGIKPQDKLLAVTTISFDIAGLELYLPLVTGAELVLMNEAGTKDGKALMEKVMEERISIIQSTPSTYKMMLDAGWDKRLDIAILCCGEAMPADLASKLIPRCRALYNMYGPTETTIYSTGTRIFSGDEMITIGKPIDNTRIYILNENLRPVPIGAVGEIYIAGEGVAKGYLNQPALTAERFLGEPAPFEKQKMYRTGDLGRFMHNGNIQCLGRADQQVKIRGYRIEPEEIEQLLIKQDGIKEALVMAREDKAGDQRLVAYILPKKNTGIVIESDNADPFRAFDILDVPAGQLQYWTQALKDSLPSYMIPNDFVLLSQWPLTPNFKIDRNALPQPDRHAKAGRKKYTAPITDAEKVIAEIWAEALGLEQVSVDEDFFELGGHSLIAVQVMTKIEQKTGCRLPITALFESPTVRELGSMLNLGEKKISWKSLVPIRPGGSKPPLYIIHGSGLTVLIFKGLAKGLDADQPVYGLQARGLNGVDEPFETMEDIAAYYISEIIEHNPTGPYCLAGYSFGGIVAFEMAKQLQQAGKEVMMLAIFDTYADNSMYFDPWMIKMSKKFLRQFPKMKFIIQSFRKHPGKTIQHQWHVIRDKFYTLMGSSGIVKKKPSEEEYLEHADKINLKHDLAFAKYKMTPYKGALDLFRVKSRLYFLDDPIYLGWKPLALSGINIYEISGDHKTFLMTPNDMELAKLMRNVLNERLRQREIRTDFAPPASVMRAI